MNEKIYIIKIGGNVINDEEQLSLFLKQFSTINEKKILVHGGGKLASTLSKRMGVVPKMVDGRRITDAETLKVVTMVYGGLINKNIVAKLQSNGCNAIGLSGADGNLVTAHKRVNNTVDYGFVGDIDNINSTLLKTLLSTQLTPVIAPLSFDSALASILNTNADTIASEIAQSLSNSYKVNLVYCFEMPGLMHDISDPQSKIDQLNLDEIEKLKLDKVITDGMLPKIDNCSKALKNGVHKVVICRANDLIEVINGTTKGTTIKN